ncbi:hypothetical protein ACWEKM_26150 [Streptomyces sp. NPDC004752]
MPRAIVIGADAVSSITAPVGVAEPDRTGAPPLATATDQER